MLLLGLLPGRAQIAEVEVDGLTFIVKNGEATLVNGPYNPDLEDVTPVPKIVIPEKVLGCDVTTINFCVNCDTLVIPKTVKTINASHGEEAIYNGARFIDCKVENPGKNFKPEKLFAQLSPDMMHWEDGSDYFWLKVPKGSEGNYPHHINITDWNTFPVVTYSEEIVDQGVIYRVNHHDNTAVISGYTSDFPSGEGSSFTIPLSITDSSGNCFTVFGVNEEPPVDNLYVTNADSGQKITFLRIGIDGQTKVKNLVIGTGLENLICPYSGTLDRIVYTDELKFPSQHSYGEAIQPKEAWIYGCYPNSLSIVAANKYYVDLDDVEDYEPYMDGVEELYPFLNPTVEVYDSKHPFIENWLYPGLLFIESEIAIGDCTYDHSAIVYGYNEDLPEHVEIPRIISGLELLAIAKEAFKGCTTIKSVTLPSDLLLVDECAFMNCTNLESVYTMERSVNDSITIASSAFEGCTALKELRDKDVNTNKRTSISIKDRAFYGTTSLQKVDLAFCGEIGDYAFSQSGIRAIGPYFACNHLNVGAHAFDGARKLDRFSVSFEGEDSYLTLGEGAFMGSQIMDFGYIGPNFTIGEQAFSNCYSLKGFTVTEPVKKIGDQAFFNCSGLETLNLCPKNEFEPTVLGSELFSYCTNLKNLTLPYLVIINNTKVLGDWLSKLEQLTMPYYMNVNPAIPDGTFIGYGLPNNYNIISYYWNYFNDRAFNAETYQNATVKVPKGTIATYQSTEGWRNFAHYEEISDDEFNKVLINDVEYTLDQDNNTATVTGYYQEFIGYHVDIVPVYDQVPIYGDVPYWDLDGNIAGYTTGIVGYEEQIVAYEERQTPWYNSHETITLESSIIRNGSTYTVTEIADEAFKDCQILKKLTIPSGYEYIGENAFTGSSLEEVVLDLCLVYMDGDFSSELTSEEELVSTSPFFQCDKLTKATVGADNTMLPGHLFFGASALKDLTLPEGITSIGAAALASTAIETIQLPSTLKTIGVSAFKDSQLKEIQLPEGISILSHDCFNGTPLEEIYIPGSLDLSQSNYVGFLNGANNLRRVVFAENPSLTVVQGFSAKTKLEEVVLPSSVQQIAEQAFLGCSSLASVNLPEGLEEIGSFAFALCSKLEGIQFPSTLKTINEHAFYLSGLRSLSIPESLESVGEYAFDVTLDDESKINFDYVITYATTPPLRNDKLVDYHGLPIPTLFVPADCKAVYEAAWGDEFSNIIEFPGEEFIVSGEEKASARGATVKVPVDMFNVAEAYGVMFDVSLPDGVELATNSSGKYIATLGDRTTDHQLIINSLPDGDYRFIVLSLTSRPISGNVGELLTMSLNVSATATAGDFELLFHNTQVVANTGSTVSGMLPADGTSSFVILPDIVGDIDGNSKIELLDVIKLLLHINKIQTLSPLNMAVADVIADGQIDLLDAIQLIETLSKQPSGANTSAFDGEGEIEAVPVTGGIDVSLSSEACTALSMDVTLPDGVTLDGVVLDASRCADHSARLTPLGGGRYRVIVWSATNANLKGTSGSLMHLKTSVTPTTLRLDGIEIGTNDLRLLSAKPVDGYATGIRSLSSGVGVSTEGSTLVVTSAHDATVTVVGTDGRLVRRLNVGAGTSRHQGFAPGVYLVNGERVIIN